MKHFVNLHKQRLLIILGISTVVVMGFILTSPKAQKDFFGLEVSPLQETNLLQEIREKKKITVITKNNSTGYFAYRSQPMGFHYDLIKNMAKDMGLSFEIVVEDNLQKALEMLNDGKGHLIASDVTHTHSREQNIQFTETIGSNRQVLVQRKKRKKLKTDSSDYIKHIFDLEGKRIYIHQGTVFKENLLYLQDMSATNFEIIEDKMHTVEDLILMVANGEIDYTVCDERVARANATYNSHIDYSLWLSTPQKLAWVVPMGADSLLNHVNQWLIKFKKTKRFAVLQKKYFHSKKNSFYTDYRNLPLRGGQLTPYDEIIQQQALDLNWDWRLLAAVIYHESRFNPRATSWAGAKGLMQLMPAPAEKFGLQDPYNPEENIKAGVKYLKLLLKRFDDPEIPETERIKFVLASYNVGMGHVIDARKLAKKNSQDENIWTNSVDTFIMLKSNPKYYNDPEVKHGYCHGKETFQYVEKIFALYNDYRNLAG